MKLLWIAGGALALATLAGCAWMAASANVEQPSYASLTIDGDFELRDYPELTVAEVTRSGSRREAVNGGFSPLAGYIFAKERAGEKIAMTAPVTQTPESGESWSVRFIMPSQYTLETLPRPAGSDVRLETLPPQRMASVRFSGVATDESIAEQEKRLTAWMNSQGLTPSGSPTYAYYNDPFTPGFMRRNEVLVPVSTE